VDQHPVSAAFEAFGSRAVVAVADPRGLEPARRAAEEVVADFDRACSRFRADSELSALNAAAGSAFPAGPVLIDAVAAALRAARLTDGDVDPTVGRALIALGYDRDFALVGGGAPASSRRIEAVPGWRAVAIDPEAGTITLAAGVALDLGATAKALAADRAAQRAHGAAGCGVLVSFGGDLAIAGEPPEPGWRIRVTDDHRADAQAPGQWITLAGPCGLATSSTTVRRWRAGADTVHHVIDPSTARSAGGRWRTVSVNAASCLDANIAATAAIVRGERALPWLQELRLPSRLVSRDGRVVHLAGWPRDADDLEEAPA